MILSDIMLLIYGYLHSSHLKTLLVDCGTLFVVLSQCSTLVRNTVVRATFKVNGKPPILGSRSPLTP